MAGIYIHIPFCKKRCTYCDFYTEVAPQFIPTIIDSIVKELYFRKKYLNNALIQTIYFGGGTPSILKKEDFERIFETIYELYAVADGAEITFEANPDDLTPDFLNSICPLPFNRISIGIQSFDDTDLKRINRRHTGIQAKESVKATQEAGFSNISIDLIYGLPFQSLAAWEQQLDQAFQLQVQHISAYGLTYEEGTVLWKQREEGKLETVDEDTMIKMYELLIRKMKENGFEAYEISNFAKKGYRSRHNTSYWKQQPYIGVGPSAHSYDGESRQWNISSMTKYAKAITDQTSFFEREELTLNDRYNDFVMVSLRTSDGLDIQLLKNIFGQELKTYCLQNIKPFIDTKKAYLSDGILRLTVDGIQISNLILIELMSV